MTPLALVLAVCALAAPLHAASIPDTHDLHKKLPAPLPDDIKDPSPLNQEIIAPEPAKEIGNELRVKPEDIPVQVIVEDQPSVKLNEVDNEEIKRPAVDLRNPGLPQRQEHETQNPEQHSDEQLKVSTIKESIEQTQNLLRESFQDISENIQNWFYKNDDQIMVQKNIQNLRDTFTSQIHKLNDTIQALVMPEASEPVEVKGEESQRNYDKIQSRLKILEDNFNNDVETLSAGVELVASLRSSNEGDAVKDEAASQETAALPASPSPPAQPAVPPPAPAQNIIIQTITGIRERFNESLNALQNMLSGQGLQTSSPPAGAQADTPTGPATPAPGFSLPNLPAVIQNFWSGLPNRTNNNIVQNWNQSNVAGFFQNLNPLANWPNITNALQNINPVGNFVNFINRPNPTTAKPAEVASISPAADKPVQASPEAAADQPPDVAAPAPAPAPATQPASPELQPGPIRQFLNSIPVVQRIQSSITNRDTPREPTATSNGQTKAGWYGPSKPPGSGDNNDINSGVSEKKSEEVKEPIKEEPIKEEPIKVEPIKEEPIKEESIKEECKKEVVAEVKPESNPEKTDKS